MKVAISAARVVLQAGHMSSRNLQDFCLMQGEAARMVLLLLVLEGSGMENPALLN